MATTPQVDRLRALAGPVVQGAGLVLEGLTVTPAGRRQVVRVTVDLPDDVLGGVPVDAVAEASQALSQVLDASEVMGETAYVLEVTSPGVDRPLTRRRHWSRARGRLVKAGLVAGGQVVGRLTAVDDEGIILGGQRFTWSDLASGRVEIEFGRLPEEPGDGDARGAGEETA